jgi:putative tricarboxylic transport membrane protein
MRSRLLHCAPHLAMLAVCVALYAGALRIDATAAGPDRLGPDVWPKAIIIVMGLVCLFETLKRAFFNPAPRPVPELRGNPDSGDEAAAITPPGSPRTLAAGAALIAGYVAAVTWLGFFLTSALFLAAFGFVGGFRRHGWNAVVSLLGALVLFVIFTRVAYVSLPMGEGPFRQLSIWLMGMVGVH